MLIATPDEQADTVENWAYGGRMVVTHRIGSFDPDQAHALLVEYWPDPGGAIDPHFHHVRQFQVMIRGGEDCRLGKRSVAPLSFHYTDPDSPYGPITAGPEGIAFLTLRARSSRGTYWMPGSRGDMTNRAGRNRVVNVEDRAIPAAGADTAALLPAEPDGLAVHRVLLGPGEAQAGPDPAGTGGQFHLVWQGEVHHDGRVLRPEALAWVDEADGPLALRAGPEGAEVLVFQFPVLSEAGAAAEALADIDVGRRFRSTPA